MKKRISCITAITMALFMAVLYIMPSVALADNISDKVETGYVELDDEDFEYVFTCSVDLDEYTFNISYTSDNPNDLSGQYELPDYYMSGSRGFYSETGNVDLYLGDTCFGSLSEFGNSSDVDVIFLMVAYMSFDDDYAQTMLEYAHNWMPYEMLCTAEDAYGEKFTKSLKVTYNHSYMGGDARLIVTRCASTASAPSNQLYYESFVNKLNSTTEGTLTWDEGGALPEDVMEALAKNPNLSLEYTFTYEGVEYTVFIPAGAMAALYDPEIPWYGPEWILGHFAPITPGTAGSTYTVQSGDTLGAIASRFGTTVSALMALNPDITDADVIRIGQNIRYR